MKTRRQTRSSDVSTNFQEVLENLHAPQENFSRTSTASEHSTLVEASKQDVDKLLDRASVRGAAAKEQSKRRRDDLSSDGRKRGKQKATSETNLFYQRKDANKNRCDIYFSPSGDTSICGAKASTLLEVKYGGSNAQDTPLQLGREPSSPGMDAIISKSTLNATENSDMNMEGAQLHLSDAGVKDLQVIRKDCFTEDGFDWEVGSGTISSGVGNMSKAWTGEISVEINSGTPEISEKQGGRQLVRRATMKDKEFAELVHKAHLLCLIARGRIVDNACNDPLLQAWTSLF